MLKRFGAQADTSNNEMEYTAMLEALQFVQEKAFVIMESDSQLCIDSLTKYRLRWQCHGWRKDDGQPVENSDLPLPFLFVFRGCLFSLFFHPDSRFHLLSVAISSQFFFLFKPYPFLLLLSSLLNLLPNFCLSSFLFFGLNFESISSFSLPPLFS
jgi:hypothetical protein